MSIRIGWLIALFKSTIFILIFFCLADLPVIERQVLKFLTIIVDLYNFPCSTISFSFHVFWHCVFRCKYVKYWYFVKELTLLLLLISLYGNFPCFELYFVFSIATQSLFWLLLTCYLFCHLFTLTYLYLWAVSYKYNIVASILKIHTNSFYWYI